MKKHQRPRRILLTGSTGQVGWELARTLSPLGEVLTPGRDEFDLARPESLREKIRDWSLDLIVNPAAYTAVDQAETEHELAFKINTDAPRVLAEESERLNIPLIHYSTDYVFDGKKDGAYSEGDAPNPLNIYGESKLKGELALQGILEKHLILRTSWIYGQRGNNFLKTILRLSQEKNEIRIVDDQIGSPTWSRMIAEATAIIYGKVDGDMYDDWGLYHLTASGETSWFKFARAILNHANASNGNILKNIPTSEYKTIARRPKNSMLECIRAQVVLGVKLQHWRQELKQVFDERRVLEEDI